MTIVTSLGNSWAMWDAGKMRLLFVGPPTPSPITSLAVHGNDVFASSGSIIHRYTRGKLLTSYTSSSSSEISQILILGNTLLALHPSSSTSSSNGSLQVFNITTTELEGEVSFPKGFEPSTMVHPSTYVNKVLVGGRDGRMGIWNIKTLSSIHIFPALNPASPSPITILTQSPAIDVIAVGHLDGTVRVVDIKDGEEVLKVRMEGNTGEGIVGVAFRMDGPPILATSSTAGTIAIWDLNAKGKLLHTIRDAHEAGVTGLQFVGGLLISSAGDNGVKQWAFDSPTAVPRLLKSRTGHHSPLTSIRYYGQDGKQILTASRDRSLRYTSVVRDSRSFELSQGSVVSKANALGVPVKSLKWSPIVRMSSEVTRSKDWEDVVTMHEGDSYARSWRLQDKKAGRWALDVEDGAVSAVCTSACGNYALAGSSVGQIRMWNLQSGQERKTFQVNGVPAPVSVMGKGKKGKVVKGKKSGSAITGLCTDALNNVLIASILDGSLSFFDFFTTNLEHTMKLPANITSIELHRDSGLLAVVCDDLIIRVLDVETRRIVRELSGPRRPILDMTFSPDSRWLITSSMDSVVRTYDVPTGQLVDAFRTTSIATGVTFSPTGDFLATSHVDSVGVHLWANKAQFSEVALRHIDENEVTDVAMPTVQGSDSDQDLDGIEPIGEPEFQDIYTTPEQLGEELLTLSLMPRSRWQTLLNLDIIRARNKPKEAPKAPEQAPFFLPTVTSLDDGLGTRFDIAPKEDDSASKSTTRLDLQSAFVESEFTRCLGQEKEGGRYEKFFTYLKSLTPAAIDLEIRSLLSIEHLERFLRALIGRLRSHRDFEAVQAVLAVCLAVHSDLLIANEELAEVLQQLLVEQRRESERLLNLVGYNLGTMSFLRGA